MAIKTNIQWCDSTCNEVMSCNGCELRNIKKGIRFCYAGNIVDKMTRRGPMKGWPKNFETPTLFPGRTEESCNWSDLTGRLRQDKPWIPSTMPRLIFYGDMGDIFSEGLPEGWFEPLIEKMASAPHIWMLLTKRPSKMREFFDRVECPKNVWCGTTMTSQQNRRAEELCAVKCETRFISIEPQWEEITLPQCVLDCGDRMQIQMGGQSGDDPKPYLLKWTESLVNQCDVWKLRPFVKQLGALPIIEQCIEQCNTKCEASGSIMCSCERNGGQTLVLKDSHGGYWNEWPKSMPWLKRREFPTANILIQEGLMI